MSPFAAPKIAKEHKKKSMNGEIKHRPETITKLLSNSKDWQRKLKKKRSKRTKKLRTQMESRRKNS